MTGVAAAVARAKAAVGPVGDRPARQRQAGLQVRQVAASMFVFGLGAALPLLGIGLASRDALQRWRTRILAAGQIMKAGFGALLIVFGALVLTGIDKRVETTLVNASPQWQSPMDGVIRNSVITCPHCGFAQREEMPIDACRFFYDCRHCGTRLRPKHGNCCVFCSYGSVPCPPKQAASSRHA